MNDTKSIWMAIVAVAIIAIIGVFNGSGGTPFGGGITNFDNLTLGDTNSASTTLIVDSNSSSHGGCLEIQQADGSGFGYFYVDNTGSWATTTASCL